MEYTSSPVAQEQGAELQESLCSENISDASSLEMDGDAEKQATSLPEVDLATRKDMAFIPRSQYVQTNRVPSSIVSVLASQYITANQGTSLSSFPKGPLPSVSSEQLSASDPEQISNKTEIPDTVEYDRSPFDDIPQPGTSYTSSKGTVSLSVPLIPMPVASFNPENFQAFFNNSSNGTKLTQIINSQLSPSGRITGISEGAANFAKEYATMFNLPIANPVLKKKNKPLWECGVCSKNFDNASHLRDHLVIHTKQKPWPCSMCDKSFTQHVSLKRHFVIHTGNSPFKCEVCDKPFYQERDLIKHRTVHQSQETKKLYKCGICEKAFSRAYSLEKHVLIHTGEIPWKCDICDKSFLQAGDLKRHNLVHTGEKPWSCDVCDKSFAHAHNLKMHRIVHTGEKPWRCDKCDKTFAYASSLKKHALVHSGEKPWTCDICETSFAHASNLRVHSMIHKGEKPWKCEVCNKSFSRATNLKEHSLVHTGEKPWKCDICDKSFTHVSTLKKHSYVHTDNKPLKCSMCEKSFTRARDLKRHLVAHIKGVKTGRGRKKKVLTKGEDMNMELIMQQFSANIGEDPEDQMDRLRHILMSGNMLSSVLPDMSEEQFHRMRQVFVGDEEMIQDDQQSGCQGVPSDSEASSDEMSEENENDFLNNQIEENEIESQNPPSSHIPSSDVLHSPYDLVDENKYDGSLNMSVASKYSKVNLDDQQSLEGRLECPEVDLQSKGSVFKSRPGSLSWCSEIGVAWNHQDDKVEEIPKVALIESHSLTHQADPSNDV